MKNLRYVCVQPTIDYYTWQVEVLINNFIKHGVNPNNMDIVCAIRPGEDVPAVWRKLADHYNYVRFFFYEDTRGNRPYVSSVRPHILKKHWEAHPYLKDEIIFYHDCDIIFTRPPDWSKFMEDDIWYGSDCRFYISAEYIESKKYNIYEKMCDIVNIDPAIPRANELNGIGAQYLMKNVDAAYWEKVEKDSDDLYAFFLKDLEEHPEIKDVPAVPANETTPEIPAVIGYNPIQKWTADMWAVLWNAWYFKHEVRVAEEMDFCWATQEKSKWDKNTIFHNAGILNTMSDDYFYKGEFINKLPYDIENKFKEDRATHWYVNDILETAKKSCLYDHTKSE